MTGDGRWIRIPLLGDVKGIVLLLPDEPLSEENWQQFLLSLDALKPALIEQCTCPVLGVSTNANPCAVHPFHPAGGA